MHAVAWKQARPRRLRAGHWGPDARSPALPPPEGLLPRRRGQQKVAASGFHAARHSPPRLPPRGGSRGSGGSWFGLRKVGLPVQKPVNVAVKPGAGPRCGSPACVRACACVPWPRCRPGLLTVPGRPHLPGDSPFAVLSGYVSSSGALELSPLLPGSSARPPKSWESWVGRGRPRPECRRQARVRRRPYPHAVLLRVSVPEVPETQRCAELAPISL